MTVFNKPVGVLLGKAFPVEVSFVAIVTPDVGTADDSVFGMTVVVLGVVKNVVTEADVVVLIL